MKSTLLSKLKSFFLLTSFAFIHHIALSNNPDCQNYGNGNAENIIYSVNGNIVALLTGNVSPGDTVEICFTLNEGCDPTIFSLVSYTAPSATFDPNTAHLQTVYDEDTKTFNGNGACCLTVIVPNCYFQVDFVKGCVIYQLGIGNLYGPRLIAGVNGGSGPCNCTVTANAGADIVLSCDSTHAILYGTTNAYNPIISWMAINGGTISSGGNTLTPIILTSGTYILSVTDSNGCTITDSVNVTGHTNVLTPGIIGYDQINCGPFKPDTLVNIMSPTANPGETIKYQWVYSHVNTPNVYPNPYWHSIIGANSEFYSPDSLFVTTYFIRCVKTDGCTFIGDSTEGNIISVIILDDINVDLGNDTTLCAGTSVVLNAANPGMSYSWNTGATTQTITATTTGTYVVTVSNQNCSVSDTIHITVLPSLVVNLGNDTSVCASHFTLDAGNPGMIYYWSTSETTQTITVTSSGTYSVSVSDGNCFASDVINVTLSAPFNIDLGNDTLITTCEKDSLMLDAGIANATYVWSTGATTQTIVVSSSGSYYVNVTNNQGCAASDTIEVIISTVFDFDLGADTTVCGCIMLHAYTSGATSYKWCGGSNYPYMNVCNTGEYCVTVSNGICTVSDTVHITVKQAPIVDLGNDTTVAANLWLNAGNAGSLYLWNTGATTQMINVTYSGTYYVTVTSPNGCIASDTINIDVLSGIAEKEKSDFNVNVIPNPVSNNTFILSFNVEETSNIEVSIMNVLGLISYSEKMENFKGEYHKKIILENAAAGIYFADILKGNVKSTIKITLE